MNCLLLFDVYKELHVNESSCRIITVRRIKRNYELMAVESVFQRLVPRKLTRFQFVSVRFVLLDCNAVDSFLIFSLAGRKTVFELGSKLNKIKDALTPNSVLEGQPYKSKEAETSMEMVRDWFSSFLFGVIVSVPLY